MPLGPHMPSFKRACEEYLGSALSRFLGKFGTEKTMEVFHKYFYYPKLRQHINRYIRSYTSCAIAKLAVEKNGLYTPLPTFNGPRESISMDYMSGLPSTKNGNDHVFVVVDRFSKMTILIACNKSIFAKAIANFFFEHVWVHFGLP